MRLPGVQVRDHRRLVVRPPRPADAGELACDGLAAVRTDHELAREPSTILERHACRAFIELEAGERTAHLGHAAQQR